MADTPPLDAFLGDFARALADGRFVRLVLSKPCDPAADLRKVTARPVVLKDRPQLSFVHSHRTRDLTRNLSPEAAVAAVREALGDSAVFTHAQLFSIDGQTQWLASRRGRQTVLRSATPGGAPSPPAAHDRARQHPVDLARPFLAALGVTDAGHRLIPAMARKWRQINKFVEVLDGAVAEAGLAAAGRIEVLDFGSGKGYLTFAAHDHLRHRLGLDARVTGVELRPELVDLCNAAATAVGAEGLAFEAGDVAGRPPHRADVMIALHACDTATDHALHAGLRAGAAVIVCSPCCHKELRPQLLSPHPLAPVLRHGIHLGQQAEMLTDGLRAMLLEACGYDTRVFEFVALEHTSKNKMILAVRRPGGAPGAASAAWRQIDELKRFYGIRTQCLEALLRADGLVPDPA